MPREDFYGEGYDGELEKRSELVYDLPEPEPASLLDEPEPDAPTGDGGESADGGDSSGADQ